MGQIENALYNAYGARQVSTIYTPNDQYWVVMELLPEYQRDLSALDLLHISGRRACRCRWEPGHDHAVYRAAHRQPLRSASSVTLSFDLRAGGVASGTR